MGSQRPSRFGIYEDRSSPEYDLLSKRYAEDWRAHVPDEAHYNNVRTAFMNWMNKSSELGIRPEDGAAVICGPGFNVADQRDLDQPIIDAYLFRYPKVVIADFSREALLDAHDSIVESSRRIDPSNLLFARRDFSGGISARFDEMMLGRIDAVESADDLAEFMKFIADQGVEEVQRSVRHHLHRGSVDQARDKDVIEVDNEGGLCFHNIVDEVAPVRFFVANMILEGMLASTESDFRQKLMEIAGREELDNEFVAGYLETWHRLVRDLNTHIAVNFLRSALEAHPEAQILTTNAVDVGYHNLPMDVEIRLDTKEINRRLAPDHIKINSIDQWTTDDSREVPPHTHTIRALSAYKNGSSESGATDRAASTGAPLSLGQNLDTPADRQKI